ncbi:MAG: leucine-rich repeat domain-containing protein, partial [Bacteroidota bacterium]
MSELALQLIENEKKNKTGKLDLGRCGLNSVPNELFELTWLKELSFANKYWNPRLGIWTESENNGVDNHFYIDSLSDQFSKLINLRTLHISGDYNSGRWNLIKTHVLSNLSNLEILNLASNMINDISFLSSLPKLQFLNLYYNDIDNVSSLSHLTDLRYLILSFNRIVDINSLSNLKSLQYLNLWANKIIHIDCLSKFGQLEYLDLSSNEITDFSALSGLNELHYLNVINNQIDGLNFLSDLPKLQHLVLRPCEDVDCLLLSKLTELLYLDLSYNKLSDLEFLFSLTQLEYLNLAHNEVKDISPLSQLFNLKHLNINSNQIEDISPLSRLVGLRSLDLNSNKIRNVSSLSGLTELQTLKLRNNEITDVNSLSKLTSLETIDLGINQIKDLSILSGMTKLKDLDLHWNRVADFTILSSLTTLESLELSVNEITDLNFLSNLIHLKSLNIHDNQIENTSFLSNLHNLESLHMSSDEIEDIGFLSRLRKLRTFSLGSKRITDFRPLGKMSHLRRLSLMNCDLTEIDFLFDLTSLSHLDLRINRITDVSPLSSLTQLHTLLLNDNNITDVSPLSLLLKTNIKSISFERHADGLNLTNNPISTPPIEILSQGRQVTLDWFKQVEEQGGVEFLYEARILIAGEPGAGKTTLFRKLFDESTKVPDDRQKSTHGINIAYDRSFRHKEKQGVNIRANVWDFGGQDIQNYLHQYFFSKDNLFILVANDRDENTRFDYWFEIISRLCKPSQVIVVRNLVKRESASLAFNKKEYEDRFEGLSIDILEVDFKTNDYHWELLIHTIEENLSRLRRVNEPVPRLWKPIREAIQIEQKKPLRYLSYNDYQNICDNVGLRKESYQEQCLEYLHWLGYALYYKDPGLNKHIFIDPQWITKGLYEVLRVDNYEEGKERGKFNGIKIKEIWKKKKYRKVDRDLM